ncbi:HEAT repeat domain-containing protein [Arachidicoccus soli]|uniref:HEAT repeat domain-containing protein n=1 Tax=Arachidicoccus soli TaxID=2341117 RepID=A0A386HU72_9BACT|nr:HEAT repeat domain-containing protein [Arachidicoccus soli]AYD48854.1 hypothetical protein D6B99_15305 [Arachidicoccus soli]
MTLISDSTPKYFFPVIDSITAFFWVLIIVMLLAALYIQSRKNNNDKLQNDIREFFIPLIGIVIYFEGGDQNELYEIPVDEIYLNALQNDQYKDWFLQELVEAEASLKGESAQNIRLLYEQLELHKISFSKLKSRKWYTKAKGIQELYLMRNKMYLSQILELTYHPNEYVRSEAQIGMVSLEGFKGLIFLDELVLPISTWNQIRLLNHLSDIPYQDFLNIEHWLGSSNESVIIFALRLIEAYHLFNYLEEVTSILSHRSIEVKLAALQSLQQVYDERTELKIVDYYIHFSQLSLKLKALETLGVIGADKSLNLLREEVKSNDADIQLAAARAIAVSSENGLQVLKSIFEVDESLNFEIIEHLKYELEA